MKTNKAKNFLLPAIYTLTVSVLFLSIIFLSKGLNGYNSVTNDNRVIKVEDDIVTPVIKEENTIPEETNEQTIIRPFISDKVRIKKSYYDMADNEEKQENSIIYYEKTYLQNSGILYEADEEFEVNAVYDGKVTKVAKDNILGDYVEITHNSNLKTIYYCLNDIKVKKDDEITIGMNIGKSGTSELENTSKNSLLFEVYYNGFTINPENIFDATINDFS